MTFINIEANTDMRFSEDQQMIQEAARGFCQDKSDIEAVRKLLDSETGFQPEIWQEMVELGWLGMCIDEAHGGSALSLDCLIPIAESMGRQLLATPFFASTLAAQLIQRAGSEAQKTRYLPMIASGTIATLALLDNEDWGAALSKCNLSADGKINGRKVLVEAAAQAEIFIVLCQQGEQQRLVIIERSELDNSAIETHTLIDETKRAGIVSLNDFSISEAQLMPTSAADALADVKLIGALLIAAESVGSTAACLNLTVEYLNTRKQFNKLIGSYQALKHPTVDMLNMMEGARSQVYHAATLLADSQGDITRDAEIACRMSKASANDALLFAGDRAVQFHGGMGFTYECDAQLYIRRAQWSQQHYGDSAYHRKRLAPLILA
ncbi:acyl-CoA dehydrogenase family protein [uncultured Pseudoteredinibacter sp.]|uniref:acyl-CoA dehydrogenase family protein n=1 Tax=uncultured Pseudoteredinibacter sp. TaxID=1641701 RepID=UPI0026183CA2|nr:acyl-CoA dehydrogenase family protein [uncultured Pseudoteredinibacter sp.]